MPPAQPLPAKQIGPLLADYLAGRAPQATSLSELWPGFASWAAVPIEGADRAGDEDLLMFHASTNRETAGLRLFLQRHVFVEGSEAAITGITTTYEYGRDEHSTGRLWGCGGPAWNPDELSRRQPGATPRTEHPGASEWLRQVAALPLVRELWDEPFTRLQINAGH